MRPLVRIAVLFLLFASAAYAVGQTLPTDSVLAQRGEHVRMLRESRLLPELCSALIELGSFQEVRGHTKEARALYTEAILVADSAALDSERVQARLLFARLSAGLRQNALPVLLEARAIADTARLYQTGLQVERLLVRTYANRGDSALASTASDRAIALSDTLAGITMRSALAKVNAEHGAVLTERSSQESRWQEELRNSQEEGQRLREERRQQLFIGAGVVGLLLLLGALVAYRSGRTWRDRVAKLEQEVAALRSAPTDVRERPRERIEPVVKDEARSTIVPPVVEAVPATSPVSTAEQEVLAAFLARMLPERIKTLQEARARDDREKMLRVVRSLRPQLVHHDAQRFERLCEELLKLDPADRSPAWEQGFDRFVHALEDLLAGGAPA